MKIVFIGLICLLNLTSNAQNMKNPEDVITQLFISTDQRNWPDVENCFANKVVLDYSSMNGSPAATQTPSDIITAWKSILPGFERTHHQLGNFMTSKNGDQSKVFCYGTASHF